MFVRFLADMAAPVTVKLCRWGSLFRSHRWISTWRDVTQTIHHIQTSRCVSLCQTRLCRCLLGCWLVSHEACLALRSSQELPAGWPVLCCSARGGVVQGTMGRSSSSRAADVANSKGSKAVMAQIMTIFFGAKDWSHFVAVNCVEEASAGNTPATTLRDCQPTTLQVGKKIFLNQPIT